MGDFKMISDNYPINWDLTRKEWATPRETRPQDTTFWVETWWDRSTQNYITQIKDGDGYQVGDADYSVSRGEAQWNHEYFVREINQRTEANNRFKKRIRG